MTARIHSDTVASPRTSASIALCCALVSRTGTTTERASAPSLGRPGPRLRATGHLDERKGNRVRTVTLSLWIGSVDLQAVCPHLGRQGDRIAIAHERAAGIVREEDFGVRLRHGISVYTN